MWKDLSMKQRADLMDIYMSKGITSLDTMRDLYDSRSSNTYADGGNIYDGTTEPTQQMYYAGELPDVTVRPRRITNKELDTIQERWVGDIPTYYAVNPTTGQEEMLREIGNGKYSTFDDKHVFDVLAAEAAKKQREQYIKNGGAAGDIDKVILGTLAGSIGTAALPAIGTALPGVLANPYVDAGITSAFAAHGLNHVINEGINGWDDAAMTALELTPLGRLAGPIVKETGKAANYVMDSYVYPRARAAAYNNITPWSYNDSRLGTLKIDKKQEMLDAAKDFMTPGKIDTSYPKWRARADEHFATHPEEASAGVLFDYDSINYPGILDFREQAWAKAMRQPENSRWKANIYKEGENGKYVYDLDAVDKIRTETGSAPWSGELSEGPHGSYVDAIATNGGNVTFTKNPDGTYRMIDKWDLHPFKGTINSLLTPSQYVNPSTMQKVVQKLPAFMKDKVRSIGNIEAVETLRGNPFTLDMTWNPGDSRFW